MRHQLSKSTYFCIPTVLLSLHKSLPTDRLKTPLLSLLWECSHKFELQSITKLLLRTAAHTFHTFPILCFSFLYTGFCSLDGSKWFWYLWWNRRELQSITKLLSQCDVSLYTYCIHEISFPPRYTRVHFLLPIYTRVCNYGWIYIRKTYFRVLMSHVYIRFLYSSYPFFIRGSVHSMAQNGSAIIDIRICYNMCSLKMFYLPSFDNDNDMVTDNTQP